MIGETKRRAGWREWYIVILCMLAFVLSYTDRQILSLLVEPIKSDLRISDTQFGLLQGLSFSLFYAIIGIPISSLSDKHSRPAIIAWGIFIWSAATMCGGLAHSYTTLLLARVGVGGGEATLSPATYSLIPDLFPPEKLGRPTAVYSLGSFIGSGLAFLLGGAVIGAFSKVGPVSFAGIVFQPWQIVMMTAGAPGLLLALVVALTVREPRPTGGAERKEVPSWGEVIGFLRQHKSIFIPHMAGFSCAAICLFGLLSWSPAYLMRVHGLSPQQAGMALGVIAIVCNGAGVLLAGWLVDYRQRSGHHDGPFMIGMVGMAGAILPLAALPFLPSLPTCLVALGFAMFFASTQMPPSAALIQRIAPPAMRSRISAIFLFFISLIGLAVGAALIGWLNDNVFEGRSGIGYSLPLTGAVAALVTTLIFYLGIEPLRAAGAANARLDSRQADRAHRTR